jgi:hypothetical protein
MPHVSDHEDFRQKFSQFISEIWIDPEASLILSVGEPSDFLSEDALMGENDKIIALPGFHLVNTKMKSSEGLILLNTVLDSASGFFLTD